MRQYLGIDVGTYQSKGVVVDGEGRILAQTSRHHGLMVPRPGWAEHDAERDWWGGFCSIARELTAAPGVDASRIRAVGASGIGPCMLPVDEEGAPLMHAVLYGVDTRARDEIEELTAEIGTAELVRACGNALTSQSVGPKILWLRRNRPELFARTARVLNSSSFLVHRLTGRHVLDHYTACGSTPLYDVAAQAWSDRHADRILQPERLPELLWTTDVAGGVTTAGAAATGLASGTPVIAGTTDAASEAVSVGAHGVGELMIMYGSTTFITLVTEARVDDARLWYAPWLFPGEHACLSGTSTSGTLTHWFREQLARELDPEAAAEALAAEAASSPAGARGITMLPYFSGERTPVHDAGARGVILGLDLTHTRADIYRALLEGIAYGTRDVLETYAAAGARINRITAVGGGTQNPIWTQAVSDVTARPQTVRRLSIGACYGNAFLAAVGVGDAAREAVETWNPVERQIQPDAATRELYDRGYATFKGLYAQTRDLLAR